MGHKQHRNSGSQFEPTESYSNENCGKVNIFLDGEDSNTVIKYKFLLVLITNDIYTNEETKKRISLREVAMENFRKVIKGFEVSSNMKVKLQ